MLPRRSSAAAVGPLAVALAIGLTGCPGGGTPSAPPARPPQPAAAKAAAPPTVPPPPATEYVYETKNRRDPFRPLITPRVVTTAVPKPRPKTGPASLEVHELKLAGVVWERRGFYALVEAPNGAGYVVRVNDLIGEEGRVAKITPEGMTVEVKAAAPVPHMAPAARLVELRLRKEE